MKKKTLEPCDFYKKKGLRSTVIQVVGWKRSCRYHRKKGQKLNFENIIPKNFCIFAYHAVYPYALSLLYDGRGHDKKVEVYCPASKNYITMQVHSYPRKFKSLYNFTEKCFRLIGAPQDILDKTIKIKVLDVKGRCPICINKGDQFKFNIGDKLELCPASFNTLLPFILAKLADPKENIIMQCPSDACRIRYEIVN